MRIKGIYFEINFLIEFLIANAQNICNLLVKRSTILAVLYSQRQFRGAKNRNLLIKNEIIMNYQSKNIFIQINLLSHVFFVQYGQYSFRLSYFAVT